MASMQSHHSRSTDGEPYGNERYLIRINTWEKKGKKTIREGFFFRALTNQVFARGKLRMTVVHVSKLKFHHRNAIPYPIEY